LSASAPTFMTPSNYSSNSTRGDTDVTHRTTTIQTAPSEAVRPHDHLVGCPRHGQHRRGEPRSGGRIGFEIWFPGGVLSFAQAKKEGKVNTIDWGSRCNVATGTLKYPSFFAGACYAPFKGNNGGSTTQGVSATTIKIVFYVPEANDPILNYIESAVKDTATNAQTIETMQNWVAFYNHFYETYGRKVVLIPYTATGVADDPVAARADAVTIATNIKPFAVWGGPILTTAFADELAARHVLCIDCGSGDTNAYFQQRSSVRVVAWDSPPAVDRARDGVPEEASQRKGRHLCW
jgi:hypothetical protein